MPLSIVTTGLSMGKHEAREVACLAGAWKQRAQERKVARGRHACLPLVRPFFFAPTFSKRLPRRLQRKGVPNIRESGFRNREILLVGAGILGFGIQNTAQGLRNPFNDCIKNPSSTDKEFGIKYPDYRIQDVKSRIQNSDREDIIICNRKVCK